MIQNEDESDIRACKEKFTKVEMEIRNLLEELKFSTHSSDELDLQAGVIRQKLNFMKESIKSLTTLAREEVDPHVKSDLTNTVVAWEAMIADDHQRFRRVILEVQLSIQKKSKEELFQTNSPQDTNGTELRQRENVNREALMKQSSQLTDDLLSVTRMIRNNTEKSAKTVETLVESSQTITSTKEEIKTMGSVIGQSKKILNKYGRRENTDKFLIFICLIFFATACLLVLRNRSII